MLIDKKCKLKNILKKEKEIYVPKGMKGKICFYILKDNYYVTWRFIKKLRKTEYYKNNKDRNVYYLIMFYLVRGNKNRYALKYGIEIGENVFDEGLTIFHFDGIVVNGNARVGKNCELHGKNCIGNKGFVNKCPIIGDNCNIGVGASILGDVKLGNNITVVAGAVVVKSFEEDGITIGGVPAKKIKSDK